MRFVRAGSPATLSSDAWPSLFQQDPVRELFKIRAHRRLKPPAPQR